MRRRDLISSIIFGSSLYTSFNCDTYKMTQKHRAFLIFIVWNCKMDICHIKPFWVDSAGSWCSGAVHADSEAAFTAVMHLYIRVAFYFDFVVLHFL